MRTEKSRIRCCLILSSITRCRCHAPIIDYLLTDRMILSYAAIAEPLRLLPLYLSASWPLLLPLFDGCHILIFAYALFFAMMLRHFRQRSAMQHMPVHSAMPPRYCYAADASAIISLAAAMLILIAIDADDAPRLCDYCLPLHTAFTP